MEKYTALPKQKRQPQVERVGKYTAEHVIGGDQLARLQDFEYDLHQSAQL